MERSSLFCWQPTSHACVDAWRVFDWHENPVPQWIITLRGQWAVKTMDGMVVEMKPGDISFGGDQETLNRQGHCSWCIGDLPTELLLVQASETPRWNPC